MKKIIVEFWRKSIRFIKFSFVGISNVVVSLVVYYILLMFNINVQISNFCAFIIGTLNGYLWNEFWVFKGQKRTSRKLLVVKFFGVYMISWIISAILLWVWIEKIEISKEIAPLINVLIMTPINYLFSKYYVFKGGS